MGDVMEGQDRDSAGGFTLLSFAKRICGGGGRVLFGGLKEFDDLFGGGGVDAEAPGFEESLEVLAWGFAVAGFGSELHAARVEKL